MLKSFVQFFLCVCFSGIESIVFLNNAHVSVQLLVAVKGEASLVVLDQCARISTLMLQPSFSVLIY